ARRQRDKIDASYERQWQRLRDARLRKTDMAALLRDTEEANAYAAYLIWRDRGADPNAAPGDMYRDQFDDLWQGVASRQGVVDHDEADVVRDEVADTPEGRRLI